MTGGFIVLTWSHCVKLTSQLLVEGASSVSSYHISRNGLLARPTIYQTRQDGTLEYELQLYAQ